MNNSNIEFSSEKQGFVYIIRARELNAFKIGRTVKPAKRLKALQTASPYKLMPVVCLPCLDMIELEESLHNRFVNKRMHGEWFRLTKENISLCIVIMQLAATDYFFQKNELKELEKELADKALENINEGNTLTEVEAVSLSEHQPSEYSRVDVLRALSLGKSDSRIIKDVMGYKGRRFYLGKQILQEIKDSLANEQEQ